MVHRPQTGGGLLSLPEQRCWSGVRAALVTWEGLLFWANPPGQQEAVVVVVVRQRGLDANFHGPAAAQGAIRRGRGEGQAGGGRGGLVQAPAHGQAGRPVASLSLVLDEEQDVRQREGGLALAAGQEVLLQGGVSVAAQPGQPAHGGARVVPVEAAGLVRGLRVALRRLLRPDAGRWEGFGSWRGGGGNEKVTLTPQEQQVAITC